MVSFHWNAATKFLVQFKIICYQWVDYSNGISCRHISQLSLSIRYFRPHIHDYICIHFSGHHAKIVERCSLTSKCWSKYTALRPNQKRWKFFSQRGLQIHITVTAFTSTLTTNEIIHLKHITKKFMYKVWERKHFRQLLNYFTILNLNTTFCLSYLIHFQRVFTSFRSIFSDANPLRNKNS